MPVQEDPAAQPVQRIASLTIQRRAQLAWSQEKAAKEADVAVMTYRRIEEGAGVQARTYAKVERALDFEPGSYRAVLDGADSIKLLDGTELIEGAQIRRPLKGLDEEARDAITTAASLTTPDLTLAQADALSERAVEELRKRGILPSRG